MTLSRGELATTAPHDPSSHGPDGDGPLPWRHARLVWIVGIVTCVAGASALGVAIIRSPAPTTSSDRSTSISTSLTPTVRSPSASSGTTVQPTSGAPGPVGSSTSVPAAAAAINRSFNTLFDFAAGSITDKLAVVADGAALRQAMTEAASNSFTGAATGARVDASTMLGASACAQLSLTAPCASVTYDVMGTQNSVLLPGSRGYAEWRGGTWLIAKVTVCGLFELIYQASAKTGTPPGC